MKRLSPYLILIFLILSSQQGLASIDFEDQFIFAYQSSTNNGNTPYSALDSGDDNERNLVSYSETSPEKSPWLLLDLRKAYQFDQMEISFPATCTACEEITVHLSQWPIEANMLATSFDKGVIQSFTLASDQTTLKLNNNKAQYILIESKPSLDDQILQISDINFDSVTPSSKDHSQLVLTANQDFSSIDKLSYDYVELSNDLPLLLRDSDTLSQDVQKSLSYIQTFGKVDQAFASTDVKLAQLRGTFSILKRVKPLKYIASKMETAIKKAETANAEIYAQIHDLDSALQPPRKILNATYIKLRSLHWQSNKLNDKVSKINTSIQDDYFCMVNTEGNSGLASLNSRSSRPDIHLIQGLHEAITGGDKYGTGNNIGMDDALIEVQKKVSLFNETADKLVVDKAEAILTQVKDIDNYINYILVPAETIYSILTWEKRLKYYVPIFGWVSKWWGGYPTVRFEARYITFSIERILNGLNNVPLVNEFIDWAWDKVRPALDKVIVGAGASFVIPQVVLQDYYLPAVDFYNDIEISKLQYDTYIALFGREEEIEPSCTSPLLKPIYESLADTDNDGIADYNEAVPCEFRSDLNLPACTNKRLEMFTATNPKSSDSDGDKLSDRFEQLYSFDPINTDARIFDPLVKQDLLINADGDNDGVANIIEDKYLTSPYLVDSDTDGLDDLWEITYLEDNHDLKPNLIPHNQDNALQDPDNDGINNIVEYQMQSHPFKTDSDDDQVSDFYEYTYRECLTNSEYSAGPNINLNDANIDHDGDGLDNLTEYLFESSPCDQDTDNDLIPDNVEHLWAMDPNDDQDALLDDDNDGLINRYEYLAMPNEYINMPNINRITFDPNGEKTDSYFLLLRDSDNDQVSDWQEFQQGTDPFVLVDADNDNLPDDWELLYWASIDVVGKNDNPDDDLFSNYQEWQNDTSPLVTNGRTNADEAALQEFSGYSYKDSNSHPEIKNNYSFIDLRKSDSAIKVESQINEVPLNFTFPFYGKLHDRIYAHSGGVAFMKRDDFDANAFPWQLLDGSREITLPLDVSDESDYTDGDRLLQQYSLLAPFINPATVGTEYDVYYQHIDNDPESLEGRQFVLQYNSKILNDITESVIVYQIILSENLNTVSYLYHQIKSVQENENLGGSAIIGMQSETLIDDTVPRPLEGIQYSNNEASLNQNLVIEFTPNTSITCRALVIPESIDSEITNCLRDDHAQYSPNDTVEYKVELISNIDKNIELLETNLGSGERWATTITKESLADAQVTLNLVMPNNVTSLFDVVNLTINHFDFEMRTYADPDVVVLAEDTDGDGVSNIDETCAPICQIPNHFFNREDYNAMPDVAFNISVPGTENNNPDNMPNKFHMVINDRYQYPNADEEYTAWHQFQRIELTEVPDSPLGSDVVRLRFDVKLNQAFDSSSMNDPDWPLRINLLMNQWVDNIVSDNGSFYSDYSIAASPISLGYRIVAQRSDGSLHDLLPRFTGTDNDDAYFTMCLSDTAPDVLPDSPRFSYVYACDEGFSGDYNPEHSLLDLDAKFNNRVPITLYLIKDDTPPELAAPENISLLATADMTSVEFGLASVSDLIDHNVLAYPGPEASDFVLGSTPETQRDFAVGHHEITWFSYDKAGNKATDIQIIDVINAAPIFTSTAPTNIGNDFIYQYSINTSDLNIYQVDRLEINGDTLPSWLTLSSTSAGNATLTSIPFVEPGSYTIKLNVSDGDKTSSQNFNIIIGDDEDGDGIAYALDAFPMNRNEYLDTDGDNIGNNSDDDDDGDGVVDTEDAFQLNDLEQYDTDNDGLGNNQDTDDDNDGVEDSLDAFTLDPFETIDTDGDGIGNNADSDDDGDGVIDELDGDSLNELIGLDSDQDGVEDINDAFPFDPTETLDNDGDNIGDLRDEDDDNDGTLDDEDAFPFNKDEWLDTDEDGTGNNEDSDDDGDSYADIEDAFPLDASEHLDTDGDGIGDNADTDRDGDGIPNELDLAPLDRLNIGIDSDDDGVIDSLDAFPLDPTETVDTDLDGIGNNTDTDDDGDGISDNDDSMPLDTDNDGIDNANDADIDGDGVLNGVDVDGDGVLDNNDALVTYIKGLVQIDSTSFEFITTDDFTGQVFFEQAGVEVHLDVLPFDATEQDDSDTDGIGNNADLDDDNDGIADLEDAFPFDPNRAYDADKDGIADKDDDDNDNDLKLDYEDAFPFNSAAWLDQDQDGLVDAWNESCDTSCQIQSGLMIDVWPNDTDNDGINNDLDPDNFSDNGAPILNAVPEELILTANSETIYTFGQEQQATMLEALIAFDAVDSSSALTIKALLNGDVVIESQDQLLTLPVGVHSLSWQVVDQSGNVSNPLNQQITVYPLLQFHQQQVITGEAKQIALDIAFTGLPPALPLDVVIAVVDENLSLSQEDFHPDFDLAKQHTVSISEVEATDDGLYIAQGISFVVAEDTQGELQEEATFNLSLVDDTSYYAINNDKPSVTLIVTEENIAPHISMTMKQGGEVTNTFKEGAGKIETSITIDDANGLDEHQIEWLVDGIIEQQFSNQTVITLNYSELSAGQHELSVNVTDNGMPALTSTLSSTIEVTAQQSPETPQKESSSSGGSTSIFYLSILMVLLAGRRIKLSYL